MANKTGWQGVIKPIGAFYPRYTNTGSIEFRNTNSGEIREGKKVNGKWVLGASKGFELNNKHVYGHDKDAPEKNVGNFSKLKAMKLRKVK